MSVELRGDIIHLLGRCGAEDAETLLGHLAAGWRRVDVGHCEWMHAAILQLLIASDPELIGSPPDFIARWSLLGAGADAAGETGPL